MDVMEASLCEDDLLSTFFDTTKDAEFSANQTVYPNQKFSSALDFENSSFSLSPSSESSCKVGREGGNPEEDEGFEGMLNRENVSTERKFFIDLVFFFH